MMTDSVEGGEQERRVTKHARPRPWVAELEHQARASNAHIQAYDRAVMYAFLRAYLSMAVKVTGLLALLLSTVILLGGYVQSLKQQDFFCVLAITVIQAAGIFQDWEINLRYLIDFETFFGVQGFLKSCCHFAALPFRFVVQCTLVFYSLGPLACAAISSWRIAKLNHGNYKDDGTDSFADMMATLIIFYSLIILQGSISLVFLLMMFICWPIVVSRIHSLEHLSEEWGEDAIHWYLARICKKSRKELQSIKGMDLIKYAAELLDSESQEDYLSGARLLSAFVNKGEEVSWVLLPSRHRIQRLIDSLMISRSSSRLDEAACVPLGHPFYGSRYRHGRCLALIFEERCLALIGNLDDKKEIRELAATVVADVAAHIDDLSNYPGAMRCISSLLQYQEETTQTYRQSSKQDEDVQRLTREILEKRSDLMMDQERTAIREHRHRNKREGGTSRELVQQGLTILERLASNSDDNRRIICSAPRLLPKITAPVYSATLIEDVKTKAWADIVTRCLKVLYQLVRAPDGSHEIFSNNVQALSNLKSILLELGNDEADHQELQLVTLDILTELSLDLSINLTDDEIKKVLITKQLQLFLLANGDNDEEYATIAGRAMVSLSTNSESNNSALIMTTQDDIIGRLTGILDDESITRRTIAAQIMANLCAHCTVDVDNMKEILPKVVLREIMSIKTKSNQRNISARQNNPALGDEENQGNSVSTNTEERNNISTRGNHTKTKEISDQETEKQEAFLSLAQVICDKLGSADLDGAIQIAVQNKKNAGSEEQRREAFVDKLKTIIDDNRNYPTADSLRIVKLCGRIAKSVTKCDQYVEIFRNKGFKSSLSEASKTMSKLESCMLFVGTDFGPKKTVRPLFSEIEKTWSEI